MRFVFLAGAAGLALGGVTPADAQERAIEVEAEYRVDIAGVAADGSKLHGFGLDDLNVSATADLEKLAGWRGAVFYADLLNNLGERPNDLAGTLQGIDNIEVARPRLRVFEAWIEQKLGAATTIRAGLYDLNSEFYASEASGLLIAPAFGVGSEIAATGPNGPSIFPTTALAVRVDQRFGKAGFVRAAVLNATAGTLGEGHGAAFDFGHGVLLIGEGGIEADGGKLALGAWGYTRRQDDIAAVDALGNPLRRDARGVYAIVEKTLGDPEGARAVSLFARAGISDGRTTPFKGGWQAGLLVTRLVPGRPDSQISFGANQGYLSDGYRDTLRAGGVRTRPAESAVELTYSDKLTAFLTLQPDLQLIWDRGGDADARAVTVATLRATFAF